MGNFNDKNGYMSGGPISKFDGGWALIPFSGEMAHFWEKNGEILGADRYTSPCGMVGYVSDRINALHIGNWPKCKKCSR